MNQGTRRMAPSTTASSVSRMTHRPPAPESKRVLIAGAGVGGLEAALALRALAPESTRVRVLAPTRHFVYRALSVGEPFGHGRALQLELARIAEERGFDVTRDALDHVDPDLKLAY